MRNIDIEEAIKKMALTKTEKKIADYIIEHKRTLGLITVTKLASNIGVSDTSVIRLLRNFGYDGYADFKRDMASRMMKEYNDGSMSVGEKYLKSRDVIEKGSVVSEVVNKALKNIKITFENVDAKMINDVTKCIMASERKYVVGFRGASSCVGYMARKMSIMLPNVDSFDRAESIVLEHIVDVTKDDCVIMYSFARYSEINTYILKKAQEKKAKIILITDRVTSPLAVYADFVIPTAVDGAGMTVSYIVPMCISEAILLLISKRLTSKEKERVSELDELVLDTKQY